MGLKLQTHDLLIKGTCSSTGLTIAASYQVTENFTFRTWSVKSRTRSMIRLSRSVDDVSGFRRNKEMRSVERIKGHVVSHNGGGQSVETCKKFSDGSKISFFAHPGFNKFI